MSNDVRRQVLSHIVEQFNARGIPARRELVGMTDEFVTGQGDDEVCHMRLQFFADEEPEADLSFLQSAVKGMGLVAMQGIVMAMQQQGYDRLYLVEVISDGLSFWPWLGAVDAGGRYPETKDVARAVASLQEKGVVSPDEAVRLTSDVFNLDGVTGDAAWHRLSQIDKPTKQERSVIAEVTREAMSRQVMVLKLDDPAVAFRLEKRFSAIRPFT